jgi:adenylate cyclase
MIRGFIARLARLQGGRWLALAALFAGLALTDFGWLNATRFIDQRGGDVLLALHARQRPQSDRVVIVDIDQKSLEDMNDDAGNWPWPRSIHGELIDHIAAQEPQAIVFDILFNEADVFRPEHDAAFAEAVARNPNVWLGMTLNSDGTGAVVEDLPAAVGAMPVGRPEPGARAPIMLPLVVAEYPEAMRGGLINFTPDSDGSGRRHALYGERSGWRFPSLAARIAAESGRKLPRSEQVLLNWRSEWKHVSYADIYLDSLRRQSARPADEFRGKIVVIGTAAPGLQDFRVTPLGTTYPGVQILATAIDNLDRGDWLREVSRPAMLPLALGLIALLAFGFARNVEAQRLLVMMLALSFAVIASGWLALVSGTFVPVFGALALGWAYYLAASGIAYIEERARRLRTAAMFTRFLDARVVADLIDKGEIDYRQQAEAREVSVLFSDIRGFTALSEVTAPEDVVAMLNGYFSRQVGVIFSHSGTLDKFIGDAIMAFWGAPVAMEDHAARAVAAALEMSDALEAMRGDLGELVATLEIGIGIHSGKAVVGFIGSNDRLDYTAIGDTVNLASRVEGLTKGIARILVTEATRQAAGDAFDWRDCGVHQVKGREEGVRLFEPLRKAGSLPRGSNGEGHD